jgi:hypothetical protein
MLTAVSSFEVILDPLHEMVLEHPLDELMEEVRGEQSIDVRSWKAICEWLEFTAIRQCRSVI